MTETVDQKYVTAYTGILTPEELQAAAGEHAEFAKSLPPVKSPGLARLVGGLLGDDAKVKTVDAIAAKQDKAGHNYSGVVGEVFDPNRHNSFAGQNAPGKTDYASKLNYHQFVLSEDGSRLLPLTYNWLHDLFPAGNEGEWPTLVIASNSNLVSPQSFFDTLSSARNIAPELADLKDSAPMVIGTYFSQRHFAANAADTMKRYRELGLTPTRLKGVSPAAEIQASQILDLLIARDEKDAVLFAKSDMPDSDGKFTDRPVLRRDAGKILAHIVGYGYSAGHMTNKDTFRILRDIIDKGDVKIELNQGFLRDSTKKDSLDLLQNVRLIGIGGMDRMDIGPERSMPREANLVAKEDFSNALNGRRFIGADSVFQINLLDADKNRIRDDVGGHALGSYLQAIDSPANDRVIVAAREALGSGRLVTGPSF